MVQPRKERAVFEGLGDKRIHLLLERQLDIDADRAAAPFRIGGVRAFIRCLHETRATAGEDVATHSSELGGELFHTFVSNGAGLEPRRAEDGNTIVLSCGATEAGEIVDDLPQTSDRMLQHNDGRVFIAQLNDVRLTKGLVRLAHGVSSSSSCSSLVLVLALVGEVEEIEDEDENDGRGRL